MPRHAKDIQRCEIQLTTENAVAIEALFQSSLTKSGVRYGATSALINRLLAEYFRANPVVSTAQLIKESTND